MNVYLIYYQRFINMSITLLLSYIYNCIFTLFCFDVRTGYPFTSLFHVNRFAFASMGDRVTDLAQNGASLNSRRMYAAITLHEAKASIFQGQFGRQSLIDLTWANGLFFLLTEPGNIVSRLNILI
jgi:hypothetical protein